MKRTKKNIPKPASQKLRESALPQQAGKALIVPCTDVPVKRSANKKIHERPTPPPLPKGGFVPDEDASPSLRLE